MECVVCGLGPSPDTDNVFLQCAGKSCNVLVHQECYGVKLLPQGEQKWYCKRCEPFSTIRAAKVKCCLCPQRDGALKRTDGTDEFAHVVCALWTPQVQFAEGGLDIITNIPRDKLNQTICVLCAEDGRIPKDVASFGLAVPCATPLCDKAAHVTCAQRSGLLVRRVEEGRMVLQGPAARYTLHCRAHKPGGPTPPAAPTAASAKSSSSSLVTPTASSIHRKSSVALDDAGSTVASSLSTVKSSASLSAVKRKASHHVHESVSGGKKKASHSEEEEMPVADFMAEVQGFLDKQKRSLLQLVLDRHGKGSGSILASRYDKATTSLRDLSDTLAQLQRDKDALSATLESLKKQPPSSVAAETLAEFAAHTDGPSRLSEIVCYLCDIKPHELGKMNEKEALDAAFSALSAAIDSSL